MFRLFVLWVGLLIVLIGLVLLFMVVVVQVNCGVFLFRFDWFG